MIKLGKTNQKLTEQEKTIYNCLHDYMDDVYRGNISLATLSQILATRLKMVESL